MLHLSNAFSASVWVVVGFLIFHSVNVVYHSFFDCTIPVVNASRRAISPYAESSKRHQSYFEFRSSYVHMHFVLPTTVEMLHRTNSAASTALGTRSIALCCFFCIRRKFWFERRAWLLRAISAPAHASQMQPTHQCLLWVSVTSPVSWVHRKSGLLGHPDCSVQTEQRGPADECSVSKLACLLPVPLFCT